MDSPLSQKCHNSHAELLSRRNVPTSPDTYTINQGCGKGNAIFNLKQLIRVVEIEVKSIRPPVDEVSACSKYYIFSQGKIFAAFFYHCICACILYLSKTICIYLFLPEVCDYAQAL